MVQGKLDYCQINENPACRQHSLHFFFSAKVKLTESGEPLEFSIIKNKLQTAQEDTFAQLLNVAIKNSMMARMLGFGRSPRVFFFKPDQQTRDICGLEVEKLRSQCNLPSSLGELFVGLLQAAHVTGNREVFLVSDFIHNWIRPEHTRSNPPSPIMILQPEESGGGILAGVRLPSLDQPVHSGLRYQIEQALRKLTFHIRYKCGPRW